MNAATPTIAIANRPRGLRMYYDASRITVTWNGVTLRGFGAIR